MDPVTAVGLAASVVQLADLAGNVFITIFQYYRQVRDAPAQSKELRDELQTVADLLDSLKRIILSKTGTSTEPQINGRGELVLESLQKSTIEFDKFLKELQQRAGKVPNERSNWIKRSFSRNLQRITWPFTQEENQRLLGRLSRYKETFNLALNMEQTYGDHLVHC
jgi:hypothetical protein